MAEDEFDRLGWGPISPGSSSPPTNTGELPVIIKIIDNGAVPHDVLQPSSQKGLEEAVAGGEFKLPPPSIHPYKIPFPDVMPLGEKSDPIGVYGHD